MLSSAPRVDWVPPVPTAASTEQTFKDGRVNIACNGGQDRVL